MEIVNYSLKWSELPILKYGSSGCRRIEAVSRVAGEPYDWIGLLEGASAVFLRSEVHGDGEGRLDLDGDGDRRASTATTRSVFDRGRECDGALRPPRAEGEAQATAPGRSERRTRERAARGLLAAGSTVQ